MLILSYSILLTGVVNIFENGNRYNLLHRESKTVLDTITFLGTKSAL